MYFVTLIWCCGSMSCVLCESYAVQMRPAVGVLVVPYSVRLASHSQTHSEHRTTHT